MFNSKYSFITMPLKIIGYFLGLIWPRDDKFWAFGAHSGEMFMGNSKYLYLEISNSDKYDISPVWFCRDRELYNQLDENGYNAVMTGSLEGILAAFRAGKVFYTNTPNDVQGYLTSGSTKINLWHGMPLKRVGLGHIDFKNSSILKIIYKTVLWRYLENYDYQIITSEYFGNAMEATSFNPNSKVLSLGYPRNDALGRSFKGESLMDDQGYKELVEKEERTVFTYLPTWDNREMNPIDYEKLNDYLKDNNSILLVKPHYFEEDFKPEDMECIKFLPPSLDVYPILRYSDVLITDYSSVFYDFLLLDRPIIFYSYDYEKYKQERGFERDFDLFTPGPKAKNFEELLDEIQKVDSKDFSEDRCKISNKCHKHEDFRASKRIINRFQ